MEPLRGVVVAICVRIQRGIPKRPTVRLVHEEARGQSDAGDSVVVVSWCGIYGVGAVAGVSVGTFPCFLGGFVGERLAVCVLAVPHGLRGAVFKTDHVVFPEIIQSVCSIVIRLLLLTNSPVANMVPELHAQYRVSLVIPVFISSVLLRDIYRAPHPVHV